MQRGRKAMVLTGLAVCALLVAYRPLPAAPVSGAPEEASHPGRLLYEVYCQNCHGPTGRGDGPTSGVMNVKPADLTRISDRNGGEFPSEKVARTIDGRNLVRGHGDRQMPIWGLSMQQLDQDTNQENQVLEKILQLTRYLESIQE